MPDAFVIQKATPVIDRRIHNKLTKKVYNMKIKVIDNARDIREAFIKRFVMSWEEFQVKQKDWIADRKISYPVNSAWYEQSYMWDKMSPDFPRVSMEAALAFLREHSGPVFFMTEKGEGKCYKDKRMVGVIAEADAHTLAARIEQEWYDSYRLAEQNMYDADAILPDDLYVFDASMKWCVVFTHETTDWESELDDPMKAAESRYCIICKV